MRLLRGSLHEIVLRPTCAAALALALFASVEGGAQADLSSPPKQAKTGKDKGQPDRTPGSTPAPSIRIAVEPLGFSAPGALYLGQRNSLVSLDFIDENRLLFTFRVPGLMHREPEDIQWGDERQIKALVLSLPDGAVTAEALWTLHDRKRYLWMLNDGHFLLRDRDRLSEGDASLQLKPLLNFPGPLLSLEMDPLQQFLVTNSREEASAVQKAGDVPSPATAKARISVDGKEPENAPNLVVRIIQRDSGKVMLVSRTRTLAHLPINSDGYIESLRANGERWMLNLNYFTGGTTVLGHVNSTCSPNFDFVAQKELLVTACNSAGGDKLEAMDTDGRSLWEDNISSQAIWPRLITAANGTRLAWETLAVNHAVNAIDPIDAEDIKGQPVRVMDSATGKTVLQIPASPTLDAGGNVALSASGRRVAVLNAGAIEVFDLPQPAALADSAKPGAAHGDAAPSAGAGRVN